MRRYDLALLAAAVGVAALIAYLVFDPFGARDPAPPTDSAILESPPPGAGGQPDGAPGSEERDPGRADSRPGPASESGRAAPTRPPAREGSLEAHSWSISGRVLNEHGEPVPGVDVFGARYVPYAGDDEILPAPRGELKSRTDLAGRYDLEGLAAGEYEVRTAATDRYAAAQIFVQAGVDSADLVVRESRKLRVYGTVTGSRGEPLLGARVTPLGDLSGETQTDAQGSYEVFLSDIPEDRVPSFRFHLEGYRDERRRAGTLADASGGVRLDVELEPEGDTVVVGGTVSATDDRPVPGERVQLYSQSLGTGYQGVSGPEGEFLISDVEISADYQLSLHPKGMFRDYLRQSVALTRDEFSLDIVLEPLATGRLTGRMLDESGQPIPHLRLWLFSRQAQGRMLRIEGDEAGYFELDEAPEGQLVLHTRAFPRFRVDGIYLAAGERRDVRLVLDWGADAIRGRVFDEQGVPVAGAELFLQWTHQSSGLRSSSTRKTASDDLGLFRFTKLGPGLHSVDARASGYIPAQRSYEVGRDSGELEVRLERVAQ